MKNIPKKLVRIYQGKRGLSSSDILLCSYPRSGSTWLRFILFNTLLIQEGDNTPTDFNRLDTEMVEYGVNDLRQPWPYQTLPRFVKTHWAYQPALFGNTPSIGIVRDPRDVMKSFFRYHINFVGKPFSNEDFSTFLHDPKTGLESWFKHYDSWQNRWAYTIQYEPYRQQPVQTIVDLCNTLQIEAPSQKALELAVERSNIRNVQKIALAQLTTKKEGAQFAESGKSTWQEMFSADDVTYYQSLRTKYGVTLYP